MKKFLSLLLEIMIIMSLTGCQTIDLTAANKIIAPSVNTPIEGEWKVKKYEFVSESILSEEDAKQWIDKKIVFNKEKVIMPNNTCESPRYKIKTVNALEYFYYGFKVNPEKFKINQNDIQVVTINSSKNYFSDVIRVNDNNLIVPSDGVFFFLTKDNEEKIDNNISENKNEKNVVISKGIQNKSFHDIKAYNSGVLLGLKYYEDIDYDIPYSEGSKTLKRARYRTLWISADGNIQPIEEIPNILLPRKNGFWNISVERSIGPNDVYDFLLAAPLGKYGEVNEPSAEFIEDTQFHSFKTINFIGNDFISLESNGAGYTNGAQYPYKYDMLEVLPVDMVFNGEENPITIAEVLGQKGLEAVQVGAKAYLDTLNDKEVEKLKDISDFNSFGIIREQGRWVLKGRLNYSSDSSKYSYGDFNIPITPPKNFVMYDSLFPSWEIIKQKVPDVKDAYSSPNKDLVVVLTERKLYVYSIKNNILSFEPLTDIDLKEGEVSVMAEWATGEYVKAWSDEVKKAKSDYEKK